MIVAPACDFTAPTAEPPLILMNYFSGGLFYQAVPLYRRVLGEKGAGRYVYRTRNAVAGHKDAAARLGPDRVGLTAMTSA